MHAHASLRHPDPTCPAARVACLCGALGRGSRVNAFSRRQARACTWRQEPHKAVQCSSCGMTWTWTTSHVRGMSRSMIWHNYANGTEFPQVLPRVWVGVAVLLVEWPSFRAGQLSLWPCRDIGHCVVAMRCQWPMRDGRRRCRAVFYDGTIYPGRGPCSMPCPLVRHTHCCLSRTADSMYMRGVRLYM